VSAVTPSAMIVQMKTKAPLDWAISPPTPFPVMWRTGTNLTDLGEPILSAICMVLVIILVIERPASVKWKLPDKT
jgi:hypothetical protein